MRPAFILPLCFSLLLAINPAFAETKTAPNGRACDSTATGVAHDKDGKHYSCDTCTVKGDCLPQGKQINCGNVTYYDNCVEATATAPGRPKPPPNASIPKGPMKNRQ